MTQLTYSHSLVAGTPENVNDVQDMFDEAATVINGNLDHFNLHSSTKDKLGLTDATTVRRGKSIIATEESRTNVAYGLMTTPDRVQNIVLPADGLLVVAFQGMWKNSVSTAGRAAIIVGVNQLKVVTSAGVAPVVTEASGNSVINTYRPISTNPAGLAAASSATAYTGDVTTGQAIAPGGSEIPGITYIFAAAGTYDISIQWAATSGSVTVKERKLWVWTMGF